MLPIIIFTIIALGAIGGIFYTVIKTPKEEQPFDFTSKHHVPLEDFPHNEDHPVAIEKPTVVSAKPKKRYYNNKNKNKVIVKK